MTAAEFSSSDKALVARLNTVLKRDALECMRALCHHDGGELSITFDPFCKVCEALMAEGYLRLVMSHNGALIFSGKAGDVPHHVATPRRKTDPVMLNSVAFLRRYLSDRQFPMHAF